MDNKVAVVGIACVTPGAQNYNVLWENLINRRESLSQVKDKEKNKEESYVGVCGLIDDIANEINIGINESYLPYMDPQLKLLNTLVEQAMSDRQICVCDGKEKIGVFCSSESSYEWRSGLTIPDELKTPFHMKNMSYIMDNQYYSSMISYIHNFTGQSFGLSASCTSSLAAVHAAVASLLLGDIDCAVAGGVSIQPSHQKGYYYDEGLIYSKSGKCRVFDQEADGTIPSDGGGIVVLKRLEDAVNDGEKIYAVISGSAMNNDGKRKMGYTVPSIRGMAEVIQYVMDVAEVKAEQFSFLEFHGTGTRFGDSIEFTAFKEAFRTDKRNYCAIGSSKPNIGYLESASGIIGLIKAVLSVKYGFFPATLNVNKINQEMDIDNSPFFINSDKVSLENDRIVGGVNAYGDGGNNVFIIVENK